jgi:hypothetical protein
MRFRAPLRAHLEKLHGDFAPGKLPSRFRPGKTAADDAHRIFHGMSLPARNLNETAANGGETSTANRRSDEPTRSCSRYCSATWIE